MKKNAKSIIIASMIISWNVTFTSCSNPIEDITHGLVYGIADQLLDSKDQQQQKENLQQERFNNLVNWNVGSEVDQEAVDKFGYDNCFRATEVPSTIWDLTGTDGISPDINSNDLCLVRCLNYSHAGNGYAPYIGGVICNKRIANDLVWIFRELYEAKFVVVQSGFTTMAQEKGLAVVVNSDKTLTANDIAVRLFKERGFSWEGDKPDGDPYYFSKEQ